MDALSNVLKAIRLSGSMFFRVELRAPYAVSSLENDELRREFGHGADHILPFHMVTSGSIWFEIANESPVRLGADDIIVLPHGASHALTDEPGRSPTPVGSLEHHVSGEPPTLRYGGGGAPSTALCGFFRLNGKSFNPLLDALPSVVVVRRDPARTPWLSATLERAFVEDLEARPGARAIVDRLTELLFVDVVQAHLRAHASRGWLAGIQDPIVGPTLARLHSDPSQRWTVERLAAEIGASRSTLADRFRAVVGQSVMRYLTAWRMELAAERLLATDRSVAEIAVEVGYESEASLNRAFKRQLGMPPAAWRKQRRLSH